MSEIRFWLNGKTVVLGDVAPTTTLLNWLRASGRTGTKEGCAEGDCGACTVALADAESAAGEPVWRAVDSCLVLLPMLNGRKVLTVEGLKQGVDGYHPVQQALVERLGSQCGYCTPGVVMSMFEACYRKDLVPTDTAAINDQMCGNLCRCTGYRPIREATEAVAGTAPNDRFQELLQEARALAGGYFGTSGHDYKTPESLPELFALLEDLPDARIVCGGTDLVLDITKRHKSFAHLISIEAIPGLRGISRTASGWRIGAATLLADVEAWAQQPFPPLHRMLRYFASRQIKNRGTVGGNVCNASPIGDTPPVWLALGAVAVIASASGERRVSFDDFFLDYRKTALVAGEILVAVEVADIAANVACGAYKVSKRRELDISTVCGCFAITLDEGRVTSARLAYGGMAATPKRAKTAENALIGKIWTEEAVEAAMAALVDDFKPLSDLRGTSWYRDTVAKNLLRGFFLETQHSRLPRLPTYPAATLVLEAK